jgi:hypothetical protein
MHSNLEAVKTDYSQALMRVVPDPARLRMFGDVLFADLLKDGDVGVQTRECLPLLAQSHTHTDVPSGQPQFASTPSGRPLEVP